MSRHNHHVSDAMPPEPGPPEPGPPEPGPPDLAGLVALMPFAEQLGIRLLEADGEHAEAALDWAPELCTTGGIMHGGALMTFADTVGAAVAFLGLPSGAGTATITSTTQMFRPVTAGEVRARAEVLHRGRTTVTVRTSLYDDRQRPVATTTQVQAVIPAAQQG
jgi:1,4-dihydroxy-2-naphthoyl-CoA hydrolase